MRRRKVFKRVICGVLAAVLLLSSSLYEQAQAATMDQIQAQIDELKAQEAQLQEKLDALEEDMAENASQTEELVRQKNRIDEQIVLLHDQISNTNEQITAFGLLIADTTEDLEKARENLAQLQEKHAQRIRVMEEQGDLSYWSVLFRANSFSDLLDRLHMIREIAAADQRRLRELQDAADQVTAAQEKLQTQKADLEKTRKSLENERQALADKRTQADTLMRELIAKGEEFEQLLEKSEEEQEKLMEQLAQKEAEYDEAEYQQWLATSVPDPEDPAPPAGDSGWITPVPYYTLTSPFGMRLHPELHIWRMHNGVDLACAAETPIYASRSGYVTVTDYQEDGAGNYVQLDHGDGYRSIYMHMTRYVVSAGQYVSAGQVIGYVGSTGLSNGNHLHFGISYNGTYVNPMEYIG